MRTKNPKVALERILTLRRVWATLRPNSSFYGRTLEQFDAEVKASLDARAELDAIDEHRAATAVRRDDADEVSMDLVDRIRRRARSPAVRGHLGDGGERRRRRGSGPPVTAAGLGRAAR